MKRIYVFPSAKSGKVELTIRELEDMLNNAYEDGFQNGKKIAPVQYVTPQDKLSQTWPIVYTSDKTNANPYEVTWASTSGITIDGKKVKGGCVNVTRTD